MMRDFAFVHFLSRESAEKAIQTLNGNNIQIEFIILTIFKYFDFRLSFVLFHLSCSDRVWNKWIENWGDLGQTAKGQEDNQVKVIVEEDVVSVPTIDAFAAKSSSGERVFVVCSKEHVFWPDSTIWSIRSSAIFTTTAIHCHHSVVGFQSASKVKQLVLETLTIGLWIEILFDHLVFTLFRHRLPTRLDIHRKWIPIRRIHFLLLNWCRDLSISM